MKEILKTLVGSRAHGTYLPDSDYDFRGVFVDDVENFLSPFRDVKNNSWIEGVKDNTSYELSRFAKMCAQGNPSALELLVAPVIESTPEGDSLKEMLPAFISKRCIPAFLGYSKNQEKKFRNNHQERMWKYAEAQTRTLYQLLHLLKTGELKIRFSDGIIEELSSVKRGRRTEGEVMTRIMELEKLCRAEESTTALQPQADVAKIEEFLFSIYLPKNAELRKSQGAGEVGGENRDGTLVKE